MLIVIIPDPDVMMVTDEISEDDKEVKKPDPKGGPGTGPSSGPTTGGKSTAVKKEDDIYF